MTNLHTDWITRLALLGLFALGAAACGGADIGEDCDDPGSTDECVDDAICTNEDGRSTCRLRCDEQEDCPTKHKCSGVSSTDIKSCQPEDK
jgi:hypothetical protein